MSKFSNFGGINRQETMEIDARRFGLVPDGVTDNYTAIQAALDFAGAQIQAAQDQGLSGRCNVRLPAGSFAISQSLFVRNGCTLYGELINPPYPNRVSGFRSNDNLFTGTEIICLAGFIGETAIELDPDNTALRGVILDGHLIESGTTWMDVQVRTNTGRFLNTRPIKMVINDPDDNRISGLAFDNIEIPVFIVGIPMEWQLRARGGSGNYTFTIPVGALPPGLSMDSTGRITGTATSLDTRFPTFRVNDGTNTTDRLFTVATIIDEIKTRDGSTNLPTVGAAFSFQLETRWGASGLTWRAVGLPDWLSLSPTGELTAVNTTTADDVEFFDFIVELLDGGNVLDTRVYHMELRFADGAIRIFGENTLNPQIGVPFSSTYTANGGYGDYTWSINETRTNALYNPDPDVGNMTLATSTSPYDGLTLDTVTGEISGTVNVLGNNTYFLRATSNVDSSIFFETQRIISTRVAGTTPRQITRSLASANKGTPYSFQFNVEQIPSEMPYSYSLVNPPTGLTIDSNGVISGTPTGANFTNGVRLRWSCNVFDCSIRGFNSGAGIFSFQPSNVHRISRVMVSVCDRGIGFNNQTFDSHFTDLYIFNCRVGMDLGAGAAGLTTSDSRIEFIHEDGVNLRTANENDFSAIYFDTCGWSSIRATDTLNLLVTGCRFFRSGRLVRGTGTQYFPDANRDFSNHVYLEDCSRATFTGNSFDFGSDDGGDQLFLTDRLSDNVRPFVGFRLKNCKEMTVAGNNLTGVVNNAFDANLTVFGDNSFKGYRFNNNAQTDRFFQPIDKSTEDETFTTPNSSFTEWSNGTTIVIPPSPEINNVDIADFWQLTHSPDSIINQDITVEQRTDGLSDFGSTYLKLTKAANTTTQPGNNRQNLFIQNTSTEKFEYSANKAVILSFWARSNNSNTIEPRLSQYADSPDNSFAAFQFSGGLLNLTTRWIRYSFYFELDSLLGVTPGAGAILNVLFDFDIFNQDYDVDISGVQIDSVLQTPFAQKLRKVRQTEDIATAAAVAFDDTSSSLGASNVQEAINVLATGRGRDASYEVGRKATLGSTASQDLRNSQDLPLTTHPIIAPFDANINQLEITALNPGNFTIEISVNGVVQATVTKNSGAIFQLIPVSVNVNQQDRVRVRYVSGVVDITNPFVTLRMKERI